MHRHIHNYSWIANTLMSVIHRKNILVNTHSNNLGYLDLRCLQGVASQRHSCTLFPNAQRMSTNANQSPAWNPSSPKLPKPCKLNIFSGYINIKLQVDNRHLEISQIIGN